MVLFPQWLLKIFTIRCTEGSLSGGRSIVNNTMEVNIQAFGYTDALTKFNSDRRHQMYGRVVLDIWEN